MGVRHGDGPAWAVALHGWARDHSDFDAVFAPPTGSGIDAVAFDLAGFGAAAEPPGPWGTLDYARHIHQALERMAEDLGGPLVLLGHSFGGRVALRLAVRHPETVGALVLCGVPLLPRGGRRPKPALAYRLVRSARRAGIVGEATMQRLRDRYGSEDYRRAKGVMRPTFVAVVNESYAEDLSALACPVEMVWGAEDDAAPLEVAQRAAAMVPSAALEVLPGVGHMVPLEAPASLAAALLRARGRVAQRSQP